MTEEKKRNKWEGVPVIIFSVFVILSVISFYIFYFHKGISEDAGDWALFGDYMGGVLGPLLALISIYLLLRTLNISVEELRISREELRLSRDELRRSAGAQEEQSRSMKKSSFETTFFNLLGFENKIVTDLQYTGIRASGVEHADNGRDVLGTMYRTLRYYYNYYVVAKKLDVELNLGFQDMQEQMVVKVQSKKKDFYLQDLEIYVLNEVKKKDEIKLSIEDSFETVKMAYTLMLSEFYQAASHYFRYVYQIIKYIDDQEMSEKDKKWYTEFLTAQLSSFEMRALYYHVICRNNPDFIRLAVQYALFEKMNSSTLLDKSHIDLLKYVNSRTQSVG